MNLETFFEKFDQFADAPDAVGKLRELVLELAVQGKLVDQDRSDGNAAQLLAAISSERDTSAAQLRTPEEHASVDGNEHVFQIPSNWMWTQLGNIALKIQYGYTASADASATEIRMLRITDIQNNRVDWPSVPGCQIESEEAERYLLSPNDILIARTGGTIGKSFIVPDAPVKSVFASYLIRVTPPRSMVARYLKTFLESPLYWTQLRQMSAGTGQPNVNGQALGRLALPLPPLAEQRRIVAKVDELMALCDRLALQQQEREKQASKLTRASLARFADAPTPANLHFLFHPSYAISPADLRKSILTLAVQGKLVPQDPNDVSVQDSVIAARRKAGLAVRALAKLASDENSFEVPESWRWVTVADVADARLGKMLDKEKNRGEAHPYLRNTNVHWFRFELESIKTMLFESAELDEYRVESGDVLICEGGHGIARSAVWDSQIPGIMFQKALHRVRPLSCLNGHFLTFCLWVYERDEILQRYYTGAGIPHFTGKALARVTFPLPPLAEQRRIVAKVEQLMALVDALEMQLATSCATAEKLLAAVVAELTEGTHASLAC